MSAERLAQRLLAPPDDDEDDEAAEDDDTATTGKPTGKKRTTGTTSFPAIVTQSTDGTITITPRKGGSNA